MELERFSKLFAILAAKYYTFFSTETGVMGMPYFKRIIQAGFISVFFISLQACVTVVEEPVDQASAKPRISQACLNKLRRFRELGVDTTNINEILDRGLRKSDFVTSVSNEAFVVLAEARELRCRY